MGLITLPDPMSMYESAKTSTLERKEIDAFVSASYSAWISFLWRLGDKNYFGLGPAVRDAATSLYLTLSLKETKNFLTLTVPQELLDAKNLAKFQSEYHTK